jgi:hypothetical protein
MFKVNLIEINNLPTSCCNYPRLCAFLSWLRLVEAVVEATGNSGQSAGSDVVLQHGQALLLADGFRGVFNKFYSLFEEEKMYFLQGQKQALRKSFKVKSLQF